MFRGASRTMFPKVIKRLTSSLIIITGRNDLRLEVVAYEIMRPFCSGDRASLISIGHRVTRRDYQIFLSKRGSPCPRGLAWDFIGARRTREGQEQEEGEEGGSGLCHERVMPSSLASGWHVHRRPLSATAIRHDRNARGSARLVAFDGN